MDPDRLAELLVAHHQAQAALDRHQGRLDELSATLRQLWERCDAIPPELGRFNAGDDRERAEIERLKRGLGAIRNHGQIRALQDRMDVRGRQRTALNDEHAELGSRIAAAERAYDDLADHGPDPTADRLEELAQRLDDDRRLRYDALTDQQRQQLQQHPGPRPAHSALADHWDHLASTTLQQAALDPHRHHHAHHIAADHSQHAARELHGQRLIHQLSHPPHNDRDIGMDLGLSL